MKLAARTTRIVPSATLNVSATAKSMAAQGVDVVNFSAGEPAADTPEVVKAAAKAAITDGFTKYTPASGIDELKQAVVDKFSRDQGVHYKTSQILVSCGAKHTLYNAAQALLDPGDEVIIPAPYWVSYPDIVRLADGQPVILETRESDGYALDPKKLEAKVTPRTKALVLNSPSNPTGALYTRETLEAVADVAKRHGFLVISDEIYEQLVYGEIPFMSIVSAAPDIADQTLVVNGVSKAFSMTGWRIGYAGGPKALIAAMSVIQSQSTSNPTSISQKAAVAALRDGTSFFKELLADLTPKRRLMVDTLNAMPGITCPTPAGAFYAFPNVSGILGKQHANGTITTSADLATYLLHEAHVACVPGDPFGSPHHLRLTYTPTPDAIERGLKRVERAIQALT
ncbi:MAG: pyridoxal phosphate-dependent aminotransferase [Nitrospira sp. SB0672_bin_25]|nr:pyridoxal phosphate-dependent aminotransferase [Nitrospira sp. SB0672_bin_25]